MLHKGALFIVIVKLVVWESQENVDMWLTLLKSVHVSAKFGSTDVNTEVQMLFKTHRSAKSGNVII